MHDPEDEARTLRALLQEERGLHRRTVAVLERYEAALRAIANTMEPQARALADEALDQTPILGPREGT